MGSISYIDTSTLTLSALQADEALINAALAGDTLADAQSEKSNFAQAIFNAKSQQPIAFTVGAGAYTWDASAEAQAAMLQALEENVVAGIGTGLSGTSSTLDSQINTAFATLISQINAQLSTLNTAVNSIVNQTNTDIVAAMNAATNNGTGAPILVALSAPSGAASVGTGVSVGGTSSSIVSSQQWTPMGAIASVTLTGTEFVNLIAAIQARRASLKATCLVAQAAIAACASVAAVQAYSVAGAGWSY
jgi:hypothetical protein